MKVAALFSVVSGAVVATALSSAAVQLQPTTVLVSTPVPAPAKVVKKALASPKAAASARPAYVDLPARSSSVTLRRTAPVAAQVDVLTCSHTWSAAGVCPGTQTEVLRGAVVDVTDRAVTLPKGAHVRVSTSGGDVQVEATLPVLPPVRVESPRLP